MEVPDGLQLTAQIVLVLIRLVECSTQPPTFCERLVARFHAGTKLGVGTLGKLFTVLSVILPRCQTIIDRSHQIVVLAGLARPGEQRRSGAITTANGKLQHEQMTLTAEASAPKSLTP